MAETYARPDWEVVDYQIYSLDPEVIDRQSNTELLLRGPKPNNLGNGQYFVCIGGAQTFGRFCKKPYPTLLQERFALQTLNLGRGGAGPSFFSNDNEKLLKYINNARFAVIQVMSGRSASNSLFNSRGLGAYQRKSDRTWIGCDDAFKQLVEQGDKYSLKKIVSETRQNWTKDFIYLLRQIIVPKILFWFSVRKPRYREKYNDVYRLFGQFPQLVNSAMINQLKKYSDHYIQCVSSKGLPQLLINRFTGIRTIVEDEWGGTWNNNWYYPSPEMHIDAANSLEKVLRKYMSTTT